MWGKRELKKVKGITSKIMILFVVLTGLSIAAGCSADKPATAVEEKYIPVEVEVAGKKTLINTAVLSGKVSSDTDVSVVPKVPGKVQSVNVKVGDTVHEGEVLFTLDTTDMSNTYQLAEARYQNSKDQWDYAKTSLERTKVLAAEKIANAQQTLANTKALFDAGAASKVQLDQAELGLKELESTFAGQLEQWSVQASDSSLKLVEVQLAQAREALDNATVTAPVSGIVSQVNVQVGNMATSAQAAVSLTNTSSVFSSLSVAENLVNRLTKGQGVKVTVPSVSENSLVGKIEHISPASDSKTHLYPLKITLENPDGLIKPGMFAKVELTTDEKADVMAVKSEAVVLKNEKTIVYVVQEDKAVAKEVATGLDTGVDIEILQGLDQGDQVIVKGQTLVDVGHKVKVVGGEKS
ncbi:MAG: RND transporter [Peptococcaceae bacterium BRH_c23]|nr:MAG: RND transporter [Peptococcaceae bacterium BRH_c23]KJS89926.1 MAG: RND transporter [Desulfosporosinus sp. BICA1-9]HBW35091.1 efflux RND transporter periplasmic adaptor subunit [Desulfosporosinus sp.]